MRIIYIETAYSYAGMPREGGTELKETKEKQVVKLEVKPLSGLLTSPEAVYDAYMDAFKPDARYSVVKRKEVTGRKGHPCTPLGDLKFKNTEKEKPETGCLQDGSTTPADLIACLEKIAKVDRLGNVYIMNADNAHHFSYVLTKMAFEASNEKDEKNKKKKKVVVNIDNHRDYGIDRDKDGKPNTISCGAWGSWHVWYWALHGEGGAEYVTLGNGTAKGQPSKVYSGSKGGDKGLVLTGKEYDDKTVLEHLRSYTPDTHEIYFTVDRDFMKDNGTSYNVRDENCLYTNDQGKTLMKEIMDLLGAHSKIIQADIIGLPTNGTAEGLGTNGKAYKESIADVEWFLKNIKRHLS